MHTCSAVPDSEAAWQIAWKDEPPPNPRSTETRGLSDAMSHDMKGRKGLHSASGPRKSSIRKMASRADASWWMRLSADVGRPGSEEADFGATVTDLNARCSLLATRGRQNGHSVARVDLSYHHFESREVWGHRGSAPVSHSSRNEQSSCGVTLEFMPSAPIEIGECLQVIVSTVRVDGPRSCDPAVGLPSTTRTNVSGVGPAGSG